MEPYAFNVPENYLRMEQDADGNYHFYFDEQGSALSFAITWLENYHDEGALLQEYQQTVEAMFAGFKAQGEEITSRQLTVQGVPALESHVQTAQMELTVLQCSNDGVQKLMAIFADVNPGSGRGQQVLKDVMDSLVYLPDRY